MVSSEIEIVLAATNHLLALLEPETLSILKGVSQNMSESHTSTTKNRLVVSCAELRSLELDIISSVSRHLFHASRQWFLAQIPHCASAWFSCSGLLFASHVVNALPAASLGPISLVNVVSLLNSLSPFHLSPAS